MSVSVKATWANKPPSGLGLAVHKAMTAWGDEVGHQVRDALKAETPVRTGDLRRSERYSRTFHGDTLRLEFTAHTPYAPYVVGGTRPHIIRPRAARALHWSDGSGSHFAKVVHHPGNKPNDFPERVLHELSGSVKALLAAKIQEALRGSGS